MTTTIFSGGSIHTLDERLGTVEALAVRGERIIAAGSLAECIAKAGLDARTVELDGATVVPGLTDSHIHTAHYARSVVSVNLRETSSLPEALDKIRAHSATLLPDAWVLGGRWDPHRWDGPATPDRYGLDRVTDGRPAWLPSADAHTAWVNSAALAALGIDRTTPDPPGGEIMRDRDGKPTGILREAATHVIEGILADDDVLPALIRSALDRLLSHGITSIHDIDGLDALRAFETLRTAGNLPIRVHKMIRYPDLSDAIDHGVATGDGDSWIRTGPVKLFADGALGSHSCYMSRDFADEPGNKGTSVTPYAELRDLVHATHEAGIAVAAHAIGDRANHEVINAFAEVIARADHSRLRYRIEHAQYLQHVDIDRVAQLGIIASMQPLHCTSDIALNDRLLVGHNVAAYPWRSLLDAGAVVSFGSDAPVEEPHPWLGIHAAVTRQRADGSPVGGWHPTERLTLYEALRAFAVAPAYASYEEHLKGRLRPGMLADFVVLDNDPFRMDPADLHRVQVRTTVVGGEVRFTASG